MAYSVTGIRKIPDTGVTVASCPTAASAVGLARSYLTAGYRLVEVRDRRENVYCPSEFDALEAACDTQVEEGVDERLAALEGGV